MRRESLLREPKLPQYVMFMQIDKNSRIERD